MIASQVKVDPLETRLRLIKPSRPRAQSLLQTDDKLRDGVDERRASLKVMRLGSDVFGFCVCGRLKDTGPVSSNKIKMKSNGRVELGKYKNYLTYVELRPWGRRVDIRPHDYKRRKGQGPSAKSK